MKKFGFTNDGRLVRGRWESVRLWENKDDHKKYKEGYWVVPKWQETFPNGITNEGIHYLLEVGFRSDDAMPVAQLAPWYAGLIDNAGFTGVNATDVMNSHTGWSEATQYDETNRQTLAFPAASSRSITAEVSFTMNASKTIEGIFVTSDNTKGGTTGTLWSTAPFASAPSLVSGNVLTANYTLSD